MMSENTFDVIVVGGGGSGLAAALSAAERGGTVLVLEKQPQLGGTTGIAVGSFTAYGTDWQRRAGVADNLDAHAEDAGKFAPPAIEARNNGPLRRFFLGQAAATLEWLSGLGLTFYGPSPEPPNRVPRMHNVVPGAKAYIAALQLEVQRRGGLIECAAPVVGLIRDGVRVAGVRVDRLGAIHEYRAQRGVVLAAGDYANSATILARYKGERFRTVEGINPDAQGDGHLLAEQAGAELVNMDVTYGPELRFIPPSRKPFQQLLPAGRGFSRIMGFFFRWLPRGVKSALIKRLLVTWQHPEDRLFTDGAILVNGEGDRFTDEMRSPEREIAVALQPGKQAYLLLDGRLIERYSAWPHFISTAPDIAYAYVKDYQRLRPDVTAIAPTLDELAARRGINRERLSATVAEHNRQSATKLEQSPWALLGPVKAYFTTTEGGAMVNEHMQVLDAAGQPIDGLYAVGQNGLAGMVLWGHGLHIAWAMTSGRLAGEAIMTAK